jgi:hypothetical protein
MELLHVEYTKQNYNTQGFLSVTVRSKDTYGPEVKRTITLETDRLNFEGLHEKLAWMQKQLKS